MPSAKSWAGAHPSSTRIFEPTASRLWELAAGACARILGKPQLFVEGNHRTAALVMSYLLLRTGQPPFVLTPDCAVSYFELSSEIRGIDKSAPGAFFPLAGIAHRLAALLTRHADPRHLRS